MDAFKMKLKNRNIKFIPLLPWSGVEMRETLLCFSGQALDAGVAEPIKTLSTDVFTFV